MFRTLLLLLLMCAAGLSTSLYAQGDPERLQAVFDGFGYEGAFILTTLEGDSTLRIHPDRCSMQYIPASTFKIPNSCIALETGVIDGIHDTLRWDGRKCSFKSWEQDMDMSVAFQRSCVWFYQELARRVGDDRMRNWLSAIDYGNRSMDGGIDRFWLDGGMRISPEQQIAFLRKLFTDALPFRHGVMAQVRELMVLERMDTHVLRGKTGWGILDGMHYGWLVGAVETNGQTWLYTTLIIRKNADTKTFPTVRFDITRALLREAGLLPR